MRQSGLFVMVLQFVGSILLLLTQIVSGGSLAYLLPLGAATLLLGATLFGYWRGWEWTRPLAVGVITLLVAFGIQEPFVTTTIPLSILIPPILALILTGAAGVIGSAALMLIILLVRAGGQGVYADPVNLVLYFMIFGGMVLSRLVTDGARASAEQQARRAEEASAKIAEGAQQLAEANMLLETQLEQQRELLDLVTTLETPTLTLADGVLVAPVVGHLDTRRSEALTQRLLSEASQTHAELVVLDITGVAMIDTAVARALLDTAQALRLLGCAIAISGISAEVAMTLTDLEINMAGVTTVRSPQEALALWSSIPRRAAGGRDGDSAGRRPRQPGAEHE
jgi:anti-anti-sigma factor